MMRGVRGPIKLLNVIKFESLKSCQKGILVITIFHSVSTLIIYDG